MCNYLVCKLSYLQLGLLVAYYGFVTAQDLSLWYNEELRMMYVDIFNNEIISELANLVITALPGTYLHVMNCNNNKFEGLRTRVG